MVFRNSLSVGDKISIKAWFGWTETEIIREDKELFAVSKNRDIIVPVRYLSHASKDYSRGSKWKYLGRSMQIINQYIEFEELTENEKQNGNL